MGIRLTEEEAKRLAEQGKLQFGRPPARTPLFPKPRQSKKTHDQLPENQVESLVIGWLRVRGWECRRSHVGTYIPYFHAMEMSRGKALNHRTVVRIGEKGEADWLCIRPRANSPGQCELFFLEIKAPGKTPSDDQVSFIRRRKALHWLACWTDSLTEFQGWYLLHFKDQAL